MIKIYLLPIKRTNNCDAPTGKEYIRDALVTYGAEGARVIQDVTTDEDIALSAVALEVVEPTAKETDIFNFRDHPGSGRDLLAEVDQIRIRLDELYAKEIP